MYKADIPGDFGRNLLNITKKLRTQNFWLKIGVSALAITSFILWLRNLKNKDPEWVAAKENEEENQEPETKETDV